MRPVIQSEALALCDGAKWYIPRGWRVVFVLNAGDLKSDTLCSSLRERLSGMFEPAMARA
jgi:hypothetical protein